MSTTNRKRISLFGNFGRGNLGNECTLEAMLHNVRRYVPDADVRCICKGPELTAVNHKIAALPIRPLPRVVQLLPDRLVVKWLKRIVLGIPLEIYRCLKAYQTLKDTDMLIMTGTGMLSDFGILPFDLHYDILRWSVIARLCGCRLLFVSVGAGPITHPLSRRFVKWSLALADYRSYRDSFSKGYLQGIGFETRGDDVYPDLAFSLPRALIPDFRRNGATSVVGVGLMTRADGRHPAARGEHAQRQYVDSLAEFVTWLLERGYTVRLIIGDMWYDRRARRDLRNVLAERGVQNLDERLIDAPASSAGDIMSQLASTDVIVASRFHNLLMAMLLGKPVVAISYHEKVDCLMGEVGLQDFCQDIDRLDIEALIAQFTALEHAREQTQPHMNRRAEAYRAALDEQYDRIFGTVRVLT